jgi:glucose-6-phosphate dehydrogenase assembly protein OpcA
MALNPYKVLGQTAPAAGNYTTSLYSVQSNTTAVLSTIHVANRANTADTYRIRIAINGASVANAQYIAYDVFIKPNAMASLTIGATLGAGDVVYAGSNGGNCSFNIFGQELV